MEIIKIIKTVNESDLFNDLKLYYQSCQTSLIESIKTISMIPSPSYYEKKKSLYFQDRFIELGLTNVFIDDLNNVIGRYEGENPEAGLAVCAHIDTVFPETTKLEIAESGDRIYCPGIGDNSASAGGMLSIIEGLKNSGWKPPFDIIFIANACEEGLGDLKGIRYFFDTYAEPRDDVNLKAFLSIDCTMKGFCHVGIGSRRLKVKISCRGGHSWSDFGRPSAVHILGQCISDISDLHVPEDPKTTYNVGVIEGGTTVNTIAGTASMLIDIRSLDDKLIQETEKIIREIITCRAAESDGSLEVSVVGDRPSGAIPEEHYLVKTVRECAAAFGFSPAPAPSSTDSNIPLSRGVPALTFGIYSGDGAHTEKEYIEPESLKTGVPFGTLVLLSIVEQLI